MLTAEVSRCFQKRPVISTFHLSLSVILFTLRSVLVCLNRRVYLVRPLEPAAVRILYEYKGTPTVEENVLRGRSQKHGMFRWEK